MFVIVEDDGLNQKLILTVLRKFTQEEGISFKDGEAAVSYIKENKAKISFIVLDGNLATSVLTKKNMDGPVVAVEIIKIDKEIPIVTWTNDQAMMIRFAKLFELEKKPQLLLRKPLDKQDYENLIPQLVKGPAVFAGPHP